MSRPVRIALLGALVVEIYGDHLIEQILSHYINQSLDVSVDLYDVISGEYPFEDGRTIYKIDSLEKRHLKQPYDALIIIGGSILHFETLTLKIDYRKQEYPLWRLWSEAARIAGKHRIKLLWNSPESPIDFNGWQVPVARSFAKVTDHAVVRDPASVHNFQNVGATNVVVGVDTAWAVATVFPVATLVGYLPEDLSELDKFIVFHADTSMPMELLPGLAKQFNKLKRLGYMVVLLPLAFTNSDDDILRQVHESAPSSTVMLSQKLSIKQTVAVLAKAELYVGHSFHGAITTACYGGEIIAFDYAHRRKTVELYKSIAKSKNYTTNLEELRKAVDRYLEAGQKTTKFDENIFSMQEAADKQLKKSIKAISAKHSKPDVDLSEEIYIAKTETDKVQVHNRQLQEISDGYQKSYEMYQKLRHDYSQLVKDLRKK